MKYCRTCGQKLIEQYLPEYDTETGKQIKVMVCPSRNCEHTGFQHEHRLTTRGWGMFKSYYSKCRRCGHEEGIDY